MIKWLPLHSSVITCYVYSLTMHCCVLLLSPEYCVLAGLFYWRIRSIAKANNILYSYSCLRKLVVIPEYTKLKNTWTHLSWDLFVIHFAFFARDKSIAIRQSLTKGSAECVCVVELVRYKQIYPGIGNRNKKGAIDLVSVLRTNAGIYSLTDEPLLPATFRKWEFGYHLIFSRKLKTKCI